MPFLVAGVSFLTIFAPSCLHQGVVSDPESNTQGYKLFTGHEEGMRVGFEYPDSWRRQSFYKYKKYIDLQLNFPNSNSVYISSDVNALNGGEFKSASDLFQNHLDSQLGIQISNRTQIQLGGIQSEEAIFTYRFSGTDIHGTAVIDRNITETYLAADYKSRIFDIRLFVDSDKYESVKSDVDRLVSTFKFLD